MLATAALQALRRRYPQAHITWAVGSWSKAVVEHHPLLDTVLDTGSEALPVKSAVGFMRLVRQLRSGHFDLAVSLVRSPLMSLAVLLSRIPFRAGLDSAGRGFGYNIRAPIDPHQPRHEADVYLDAVRALGSDAKDCWANVPVHDADRAAVKAVLADLQTPFLVIHPGGGRNPGMVMDAKRWPAEHFAALAERLSRKYGAGVVIIGGAGDKALVDAVASRLQVPHKALIGQLSFGQIAALAQMSMLYVGNDTGMTHLAAAAGAHTVMILGPSDPIRYAPFTPDAIALWKPAAVQAGGVAQGAPTDWDWTRDGIGVDEVEQGITNYMDSLKG